MGGWCGEVVVGEVGVDMLMKTSHNELVVLGKFTQKELVVHKSSTMSFRLSMGKLI